MNDEQSQRLYDRASKGTPGGVHSNTRAAYPYPTYFTRAQGPYLYDVDGHRYLDFVVANGAILLGHGHPAVQDAVQHVLQTGLTAGSETSWAVEAVELLLAHVPTAEQARFANSGTEAVMHALDLARTVTGRHRVAKVEGAYHGWHSSVYVSTWPALDRIGPPDHPHPVPGHAGVDPEVSARTLILPFNDVVTTRRLLETYGGDLAAVIVEPVMMDIGYIEATAEYIALLREITARQGIVLIFDELLTGFRVAPGGAQQYYGVTPDLSTFGKAIANGYPIAAVLGKQAILEAARPGGPCQWVGTFNGHAVSVAAVVATLHALSDGQAWATLEARTRQLETLFTQRLRDLGRTGVFRGRGGNFHWYFTDRPVVDYRTAATADAKEHARFAERARERGVWIMTGALAHHSLTLAHEDDHLAALVNCL